MPICAQTAPGRMAASIPWSRATERTAAASASMVMTTPAPATASAGSACATAPAAARLAARSGVRFHTSTGSPARSRLWAMPAPIVPKPRTATRAALSSVTRVIMAAPAGYQAYALE